MAVLLEGTRVIEWASFQQGPVAGSMLGDLGAEVIKIEQPGVGDPGRGMMKVLGVSTGVAGRNFYFEYINRNKRSITIDLKKDKGKEIIYRLVEKSDVFLTNWRQGVAKRLKLGYETLYQYNPRLIYAAASGWGLKGPLAERPGFDAIGLARSGMMFLTGEPGMPPLNLPVGFADQMGAIFTTYGILAALFYRERHGSGQYIHASLLGSMVAGAEGLSVAAKLIVGKDMGRASRAKAGNPLRNYYKCKDGKWIAFSGVQGDRHWPIFCRVLGMQELEKDPRFENMEAREKHAEECVSTLDKVFVTKTREEWVMLFEQGGDIPFTPLHDMDDVVTDRQVLENDYIVEFDHPVWGKIKTTGFPVHFSNTPASIRREAPELGQHTEEVLIEILGYTWDEIAKLKEEEVI